MKKTLRWFALVLVLSAFVYMISVVSDKRQLQDGILRLHVVANSDDGDDQAVKLQVRDAVLEELETLTAQAETKDEAQDILAAHLDRLEAVANEKLASLGVEDRASVSLELEAFPTREYDTFTLPAGVYDSLRVTIGAGEGRNWWCVVFPGLCVPAASDGVADTAAGAGFSESASGAITGAPRYEIRFYLLDLLGRLENFFHKG